MGVISMALIGVLLAASVAMGDFCVNIDSNVVSYLPTDAAAEMRYYFDCQGKAYMGNSLHVSGKEARSNVALLMHCACRYPRCVRLYLFK
jgi:hypothetical protein